MIGASAGGCADTRRRGQTPLEAGRVYVAVPDRATDFRFARAALVFDIRQIVAPVRVNSPHQTRVAGSAGAL